MLQIESIYVDNLSTLDAQKKIAKIWKCKYFSIIIYVYDLSTLDCFDVVEVARGAPGSSDWNSQFKIDLKIEFSHLTNFQIF